MITHAGQPMIAPTRTDDPATGLIDWVKAHIDPRVAVPWVYRAFPGKKLARVTWPTGFYPAARIEVNTLYWYPGAMRWCYCHLLCASTDLEAVRSAAHGSDGKASNKVTLRFEVPEQGADGVIETQLHLLPTTPQMRVDRGEGEDLEDFDGCHLLTLVDERFYWQGVPMPPYAINEGTTWGDLIGFCAAGVGASIAHDPVPAEYLLPHRQMQLQYEAVPPVLDACLYNVGQKLIRELSGEFKAISAATSAARFAANLAVSRDRMAGGARFQADA